MAGIGEALQYYLLLRQIQKDSRVSHAHLILVHGQLLYSSKIVAYAPISEIDTAITKATEFFKIGILPELIGRWFSYTESKVRPSKLEPTYCDTFNMYSHPR